MIGRIKVSSIFCLKSLTSSSRFVASNQNTDSKELEGNPMFVSIRHDILWFTLKLEIKCNGRYLPTELLQVVH